MSGWWLAVPCLWLSGFIIGRVWEQIKNEVRRVR